MSLIETLKNNFAKKPSKNEAYLSSNPNAKINIINNKIDKVFFQEDHTNFFLGEAETGEKFSIYFRIPENHDLNQELLSVNLYNTSGQGAFFIINIGINVGNLYFDFTEREGVRAISGLSSNESYGHIITNHKDFTIELFEVQE